MIDSKIIRYSSINTHYYLPTELKFKTNLKIALSKASRAVIDRFLIILNIYNKTIDDNTLNLILCRLPIILFQYEEQQLKLKVLQLYIHSHKNKDYKSEINFSAWFESIFYIQNSFLCNDYIGSNIF